MHQGFSSPLLLYFTRTPFCTHVFDILTFPFLSPKVECPFTVTRMCCLCLKSGNGAFQCCLKSCTFFFVKLCELCLNELKQWPAVTQTPLTLKYPVSFFKTFSSTFYSRIAIFLLIKMQRLGCGENLLCGLRASSSGHVVHF